MELFLQAMGAIFTVLLALLLLGVLFIYLVFRRARKHGGGLANLLGGAVPTLPRRVHLNRQQDESLPDKEMERFRNELHERGFTSSELYTVAEMGTAVLPMHHEEGRYAFVYHDSKIGAWVELQVKYTDGSSYTVTNATLGGNLERPPERRIHYERGASVQELLDLLAAESEEKEIRVLTPEELPGHFEEEYAGFFDWQLSRGGMDEVEIKRIMEESETKAGDKEVEAALKHQQTMNAVHATDSCREQFLKSTTMSPYEWERIRNRVVIIHELMQSEDVLNVVEWQPEEELTEVVKQMPARSFFQHLTKQDGFPGYSKIGETDYPCAADVYMRE